MYTSISYHIYLYIYDTFINLYTTHACTYTHRAYMCICIYVNIDMYLSMHIFICQASFKFQKISGEFQVRFLQISG